MATLKPPVCVGGKPGLRSRPEAAKWTWVHYLALLGVPWFFYEAWTITAWIADGPEQVTMYRDPGSVTWYAAKVMEILVVGASIPVIVYAIRGCRRQRKFFTFDVLWILAASTLFWADLATNFFVPTFLESSNFVNVTGPCGHMPFVVNPDCGRAPDAIVLDWFLLTFVLLGIAIVAEPMMARARGRWPSITNGQLVALLLVGGLLVELVFEPIPIALGLWTYPSPEWMSIGFGEGKRMALTEFLVGPIFFAVPVLLRAFRDDRGHNVVERGYRSMQDGFVKTVMTFFTLFTALQAILWIGGNLPTMAIGPFEEQWPRIPAHLVNDVCDSPGITGTRYGECPGSPGFRMPGRTTNLPGESP